MRLWEATSRLGGGDAGAPQVPSGAVRLSSTSELLGVIDKAASVTLGAYVLRQGNPLIAALERAAERGADVHVRLGTPYRDATGGIARANDAVIRELRDRGIDAKRFHSLAHAKAAIVDGCAYLDDRNWSSGGRDTIVADSRPNDVKAMERVLAGDLPPTTPGFAAMKPDALRLERNMIASSTGGVDIETEAIGSSTVSKAIRLAAAHERVRLIVSADELKGHRQEIKTLEKLAAAGVEVRVGAGRTGIGNEKFCVAGESAWIGSANATWSGPGYGFADWGLCTNSGAIASALQQRFEDNWSSSRPYTA